MNSHQTTSESYLESSLHQPIENQIIDYLRTLEDNHTPYDQKWIKTLLEDSHNNSSTEISDLGTIINITVLDTVAAKLLNINSLTAVKWALVKKYIKQVWEHNNLETEILNKYLIDNP